MAKTILVVDDERKIVTVLKGYLEQAGYRVLTAGDGQMALTTFRHAKPDLVILDLMLPGIDGLDVCRVLRRESSVPIIMLTARAEEADRLIGLELGADDYVVKPFSPREVVARVRAVLRRVEGEVAASELLRTGDISLDLAAHQATVAGRLVELTPMEFELLSVLTRSPGRTFTRTQLLQQIQDSPLQGFERTVDVHIRNIRAKIESDPKDPRYILTIYGVGYKLAEPTHAP
jgi:two-component system, OmpR family, alkaline phosphatase synthesis response regulator PhoP